MPRKKNDEPTVRVTVTMPQSAYDRFERMAKLTNSEVNTFIRMLASFQLLSMEAVYLKPAPELAPSTYEQAHKDAQDSIRGAVPALFPDVPDAAALLGVQPEPEPEPVAS